MGVFESIKVRQIQINIYHYNLPKFIFQNCYNPENQNSLNDITYSPEKNNKELKYQKIQTKASEPIIKESNTHSSIHYEQTKTTTNLNSISNDNMISIINRINNNHFDNKYKIKDEEDNKKIIRAERKKSTIAEFQQIKIPTNKKDNANLNQKNNINSTLYTNSNNTKNTGVNTYSSSSHIKKALFSTNENNLQNVNYTNLDLEVINSWNLPKGLKMHINKDHLQNSLRNINDGRIYFGFQKDINELDNKPYIDYLLLPKDNDYDDKFIGIHFQIKYDENNFKYYIKDLGSGYGTFVKLTEPVIIKNNLLINIGETFIVFTINEDKEKSDDIILKIFTGNGKSEIFEFNPKKKNVIIGRDINCDVYMEDKMLSRKHCYIYYEKSENNNEGRSNWFIKDGDLDGKKSTNDTWIYALEDTLIYDQMIFKANHSLFKCNCS